MLQNTTEHREAKALLRTIERIGTELIRIGGMAHVLVILHQHETICSWVLDDLQVALDHAQRAILHYRQQHEVDLSPSAQGKPQA